MSQINSLRVHARAIAGSAYRHLLRRNKWTALTPVFAPLVTVAAQMSTSIYIEASSIRM